MVEDWSVIRLYWSIISIRVPGVKISEVECKARHGWHFFWRVQARWVVSIISFWTKKPAKLKRWSSRYLAIWT